MSLPDVLLYMQAYEDKDNDQWRHTREITYMIYCSVTDSNGRPSIFDWFPLKGDPSKEERRKQRKKKHAEKMQRTIEQVKRLEELGVIQKLESKKLPEIKYGRRNKNTDYT
jgi:hypothetical protein